LEGLGAPDSLRGRWCLDEVIEILSDFEREKTAGCASVAARLMLPSTLRRRAGGFPAAT
jgi:hypothetical protein